MIRRRSRTGAAHPIKPYAMTLPVTALLPLALALLLISALGFDLLRRLGNGRKPRAEGLRRPPGAARGTRPARQGEAGGSRRPASGPSATGQHRRTLAAPPCPPTSASSSTPSPGALAGPRGGA
ncbi:MAG: hypothetical protein RL223_4631, partial [Pseudomonadota bacterium]